MATGPVFSLPSDASVEDLGLAVRKVLAASSSGVPHPQDWTAVSSPVLEAAGVRSWSTFERDALVCEIADEDEVLAFTPTRNLGAGKGYEHKNDQEVRIPSISSYAEIGSALLQAFGSCE